MENPDGTRATTNGNQTDDPDAKMTNGNNTQNNIVHMEDASQPRGGGAQKKSTAAGTLDKKIPNDQRNTTPYMTKYERARVLGTRALQIRYVMACIEMFNE